MTFAEMLRRTCTTGGRDTRGTSEILGLVFAFALIISLIATSQLALTPVLNAGDEADHHHRVTADLATLDSAVFGVAGTDETGRFAVETDISYPERYLVVSPPDSTGTFATTGENDAAITGAVAVSQASAYWDGSSKTLGTTQTLVYTPNYNERNSERLHIESGASYLVTADGTEIVHRQSLIRGTDVSLVLLDGELGGRTVAGQSVRITPQSASERAITVRSTASDPLTLEVPTALSNETWQRLLANESAVQSISYADAGPGSDYGTLTVELAPGLYNMHLAHVTVGSPDAGGAIGAASLGPDDEVAYLSLESQNGTWVPTSGRETVVVRAYDKFGAPVSGATVEWENGSYGSVSAPDGAVTDERGRVSLQFTADDVSLNGPKSDSITVQVVDRDETEIEVAFEVREFDDGVDIGPI
ncbi:hypothetical protein ACH9L7_00700 [Haloferax sp. S1W]|uniref:hypothetical protein n=1 Tax=Haloferax sp. S1W TaxID=3377110 RepID=UPI0037C7650A